MTKRIATMDWLYFYRFSLVSTLASTRWSALANSLMANLVPAECKVNRKIGNGIIFRDGKDRAGLIPTTGAATAETWPATERR